MMLRDELDEWTTAAPAWLNRILRSHLEALDLLESHEAEAAAMRAALIAVLPVLQQPVGERGGEGSAPSLLSLALGERAAVEVPAVVSRGVAEVEGALRSSAGNSMLEDFVALRRQRRDALALLRDLVDWLTTAAPSLVLPPALAERVEALLAPVASMPEG
jgi:hypothetical protein